MRYEELMRKARERMAPNCKVCPECNGKACRGQVPGVGGRGSGRAFIRNVEYLSKIDIQPDLIHEDLRPDTSFRLFGHTFKAPIFAAPIAGMKVAYNGYLTDEEYARFLIKGCRDAGCMAFTGDGPPPEFFGGPESVFPEAEGWVVPTVKPWRDPGVYDRLDRIKPFHPFAVAMDIDGAGYGYFSSSADMIPKTTDEIRAYKEYAGCPFILKGILSVSAAEKAAGIGVDAIVVSNHGGRIYEHMPSAVEMLPAIREAVGKQLKIFVDGGIRSGADVFKAIAMGADAVLIGRPYVMAAHGGGQEGVAFYTERVIRQLEEAMKLTGCMSLEEITEKHIFNRNH